MIQRLQVHRDIPKPTLYCENDSEWQIEETLHVQGTSEVPPNYQDALISQCKNSHHQTHAPHRLQPIKAYPVKHSRSLTNPPIPLHKPQSQQASHQWITKLTGLRIQARHLLSGRHCQLYVFSNAGRHKLLNRKENRLNRQPIQGRKEKISWGC